MASARDNFNLFGLDLSTVPDYLRQGWSEAMNWSFFKWLMPAEPVRLLLPNVGDKPGGESVWPAFARMEQATVSAVVLPDELVLRRRLRLPHLSGVAQRQALELEVRAASPFPLDEIVWGYRAEPDGNGVDVELAFAARAHVLDYLRLLQPAVNGSDPQQAPEVWVDAERPLLLEGFGESRRQRRERRRITQMLAMVALCLVLLFALAASPVLFQRAQVLDFNARFEAHSSEVAPVVADRDALGKRNLQLQTIAAYAEAHPDPRALLGKLSTLLPDTVYLTNLDIRGRAVTIGGIAENAASLMELLGAQPDFRDVRAPAAISRDPVSGRETFTVEFKHGAGDEAQ